MLYSPTSFLTNINSERISIVEKLSRFRFFSNFGRDSLYLSVCFSADLSSTAAPKFGKHEKIEFNSVVPDLVQDLTAKSKDEFKDLKQVQKWVSKVGKI